MPDLTTLLAKFLNDLYAGTLGVTLPITTIAVANGTSSLPSFTFATESGTGFYHPNGNRIALAVAGQAAVAMWIGANQQLRSDAVYAFVNSTNAETGTIDTGVSRTAAGVIAVGNGTQGDVSGVLSAAEVRGTMAANGGFISVVKNLTELTTIAAAATTTTAIQIPANAIVLGVSVRVVTIIPTAATFTVTSATPTKTWNTAAVAVAAGSTDSGTLGAPSFQTTASVVTITPNLTPGAATGQVRVTIYYYTITPPTS